MTYSIIDSKTKEQSVFLYTQHDNEFMACWNGSRLYDKNNIHAAITSLFSNVHDLKTFRNPIKPSETIKYLYINRPKNVVRFVYQKDNERAEWRKIDMIEDRVDYIKGYDLEDGDQIKTFRTDRIIGGEVHKV